MFLGELVVLTHLTSVPRCDMLLLRDLVRWLGCCGLVSCTNEKSRRWWWCWDCGAAPVASAVPLPPCQGETWTWVLNQPALLCKEPDTWKGWRTEKIRKSGCSTTTGVNVVLFGRGQRVQPDRNTTRTSHALGMTQLPIRGEEGWFLVGLKMAVMVSRCCPASMQDEPRSQLASWWSASHQRRGRCLWWRK